MSSKYSSYIQQVIYQRRAIRIKLSESHTISGIRQAINKEIRERNLKLRCRILTCEDEVEISAQPVIDWNSSGV